MNMQKQPKKSAVVICPGRGTYTREELDYLSRYHQHQKEFIAAMDSYREQQQQPTISELDQAKRYQLATHNTGDNASALIYTCALADFLSIDREQYDIVAVTGNSMGWYLALAAGGAVNLTHGAHIVNTMGTLMHKQAEGGQIIYPLCNADWQYDPALARQLDDTITQVSQEDGVEIFQSIDLGLTSVIAANDIGIKKLLQALPKVQERYPFALPNHGAFHSPLMQPISDIAFTTLPDTLFSAPEIPLIDGRGHIWQPYSTDTHALYRYTFDHQVCQTYDYSKAIDVACKEFAPDCLIILGPGATLGPPTAQQLIKMHWRSIDGKTTFKTLQKNDPFILSMGIDEQRQYVTCSGAQHALDKTDNDTDNGIVA